MLYHSKPEGNNDTERINLTNSAPINATTFSVLFSHMHTYACLNTLNLAWRVGKEKE